MSNNTNTPTFEFEVDVSFAITEAEALQITMNECPRSALMKWLEKQHPSSSNMLSYNVDHLRSALGKHLVEKACDSARQLAAPTIDV